MTEEVTPAPDNVLAAERRSRRSKLNSSSTGRRRSRQQAASPSVAGELRRDWNELYKLLRTPELTQCLFHHNAADSCDTNKDTGMAAEAAEAATAAVNKFKELQAQLMALAGENDSLRARADQADESETVQRLRQQLAEERAMRLAGVRPSTAAAAAASADPSATSGGQGWTSAAKLPRVLARLRRRNTLADVTATAGEPAGGGVGGGGSSGLLGRDISVPDGLCRVEDVASDDATPPSLPPVGDSGGSLAGRAKGWIASGLINLMEDMQAPTEAEKLAAASAGDDQLSARRLKVNCTRFGRNTQPIFACIDGFVKVIRWKSPSYTALVVLVYYSALINNYLLPLVLLLCILRLLLNYMKYRLHWDVEFNLIADYEESDSEDSADKEKTVGTQVNFVVHVAKKVQNLTGKISDNLEKFKNLVTWRSTQHTQVLLWALVAAFLASLVIPTSTYLFCVSFYLGIKFFLIDAMFAKYPRLRRKYDSVDRMWRTLPTDQQVGYHQTNKDVEKYILPYSDEDQVCSGESRADRSPLGSDDEEFCQVFALPNMECPLTKWKGGKRCAIICKEADKTLPDSVKHGKLFLTRSFLCFERGKDRGKAKKRNIVIPLTMIRCVRKTKPFAWLPAVGVAIEVQIRGMEKALTFGAIISRDELFDSLIETGRRACLAWALQATAEQQQQQLTMTSGSSAGSSADLVAAAAAAAAAAQSAADEPPPPPDMELVQSVNQALLSDSDTDD